MPDPLLWYPPAPDEGALSTILTLPPDDWILEPKYNGIRVVWYHGQPWTRHGKILSRPKGAHILRTMLAGVSETLDGEWIQDQGIYYAFDLPDVRGDYDERTGCLDQLIQRIERLNVMAPTRFNRGFSEAYAFLRAHAEGVVMKRRASAYSKQAGPARSTRDWLKRRFKWDIKK